MPRLRPSLVVSSRVPTAPPCGPESQPTSHSQRHPAAGGRSGPRVLARFALVLPTFPFVNGTTNRAEGSLKSCRGPFEKPLDKNVAHSKPLLPAGEHPYLYTRIPSGVALDSTPTKSRRLIPQVDCVTPSATLMGSRDEPGLRTPFLLFYCPPPHYPLSPTLRLPSSRQSLG